MKVNVVADNRSWILQRMAKESIAHPAINGKFNSEIDLKADINYFVNYDFWKPCSPSSLTVASFTHHDPKFYKKWQRVEKYCDGAVYMAHRYKPKAKLTACIPPAGLTYERNEHFRIGIVGSQYTNGRKGEDRIYKLALQLMHLPIEWHFFGGNWSILMELRKLEGDSVFNHTNWESDQQAISFYKSLDLYFTAAKVEGGPVPALEAAKVGVPILAFDVGNTELWGPFATIVSELEEARECIEHGVWLHTKRYQLSRHTWEKFALDHYHFFRQVLDENGRGT